LVEHTFTFEGNGLIRDYPGNYTDYRNAKQKEREQQSQQAAQSAKTNPKPITQAQQSDETRKAIKRLEKQLAQLEEKKTKLTASFDNPNLNPTQIADLSKQLADTNNEIEMKELEWLELME
jgi:ABC transport system ATP-binding/permease protein